METELQQKITELETKLTELRSQVAAMPDVVRDRLARGGCESVSNY